MKTLAGSGRPRTWVAVCLDGMSVVHLQQKEGLREYLCVRNLRCKRRYVSVKRLSAAAPFIEAGPLCDIPAKKCIEVRFVDGDLVHVGHEFASEVATFAQEVC